MTYRIEIEGLLAERIGLDTGSVGSGLIQQAIQARLSVLGLAEPGPYLRILRNSDEELAELVEEVVIPESWFFRDKHPFQRLEKYARENWGPSGPMTPLKALSIPCAAGEEAYSIAITLLEAGLLPDGIQVDAGDISERQLTRARRGVYRANAFRGEGPRHRLAYFRELAQSWEIDPRVRRLVRFFRANLLADEQWAGQKTYDVIFCRNLLIYLTKPARQRVVATLDRLLNPGGILFVGHAEMIADLQPHFLPDEDWGSFAYRRGAAGSAEREARASGPKAERFRETPLRFSPEHQKSGLPRAPDSAPTSPEEILDEARRLADQRQYAEAVRLCDQLVRNQVPSASVYSLLGMISLATGESDKAEAYLMKAVYLDDADVEALLALGLICQGRGDADAAARYRRRAERARLRGEAK